MPNRSTTDKKDRANGVRLDRSSGPSHSTAFGAAGGGKDGSFYSILNIALLWLVVASGIGAVLVFLLNGFAGSGWALFRPLGHLHFNSKKNVIFMISDGFGTASELLARDYHQYVMNGGENELPPWQEFSSRVLPLDTMLVGQSRTRSASSWVTDSAAGATAFSCGLKSYNGAMSVNETRAPCISVLEVAKKSGYKTALVATSRITHATPGAFNSHTTWRDYEDFIAQQQLGETPFGRVTDLMFGGGRCYFEARNVSTSCRTDDRDLLGEAKSEFGFKTTLTSRDEFDRLDGSAGSLPLLGLFAKSHMEYEIDRSETDQPSLWEMTSKALEIMADSTSSSGDRGFFMMVEGSRIDMSAHDNDPATHIWEILAYQRTVEVVKKFVDENPGTVMISVADHETGGLSVGRQLTSAYPTYEWKPEALKKQVASTPTIARAIKAMSPSEVHEFVVNTVFRKMLGISDYTSEELAYLSDSSKSASELTWYLSEMMSKRAVVGWATHGHTASDVNLYAYAGQGHHERLVYPLRRSLENVELGEYMHDYLQLSKELTQEMQNDLVAAWEEGRFRTFPEGRSPVPSREDILLMLEKADGEEKAELEELYHHLV